MKKKIILITFSILLIGVIVLNVSISFGGNNHYDLNLKQLESYANAGESQLKTYACENSPTEFMKRCESAVTSEDCNLSNEKNCTSGSGVTGGGDATKCVTFGHFNSPCFRCGYTEPPVYFHSWRRIGTASPYSWIIYECSKCQKSETTGGSPTREGCIR